MDIPVYKIEVVDSDQLGIALVEDPAIEEHFEYFSKEEDRPIQEEYFYDQEHKIISGPVMIPNRLITRLKNGQKVYVFYDKRTIERFVEYFLKNGMKFNLDHTGRMVEIQLLETYLLKKEERGLPEGTWMMSARVEDPQVWQEIKEGRYRGFSVQSAFSFELEKIIEDFSNQNNNNENQNMKEELKQKFYQFVDSLFPAVEKVEMEEQLPGEPPVETPTEETPDEMEQKLELLMEHVTKMEERLQALEAGMVKTQEQVQEFSRQPLTPSVTEQVPNPAELDIKSNPALRYFQK